MNFFSFFFFLGFGTSFFSWVEADMIIILSFLDFLVIWFSAFSVNYPNLYKNVFI